MSQFAVKKSQPCDRHTTRQSCKTGQRCLKEKGISNPDSLQFAHLFSIMLFSYMKVLQLFITKLLYCLGHY